MIKNEAEKSEKQSINDEDQDEMRGISDIEEVFEIRFSAFSVVRKKDRNRAEREQLLPREIE